jgi:hypothetical protein
MLFVLSTIVGCKRKCEIQDKLSQLDIVDTLNKYIDYIEWGNILSGNTRPSLNDSEINFEDDAAYHGGGCNCDTESALKIQYLRFIYTYSCRDKNNVENKINLLSMNDLVNSLCPSYFTLFYLSLFKYYKKYNSDDCVKFNKIFHKFFQLMPENFYKFISTHDDLNSYSHEVLLHDVSLENISKTVEYFNTNYDKIGLLNKLVIKFIQECYFSSSKFWLASCIEVMLRGNNTFYQNHIVKTGLMVFLLYDIIYTVNEHTQILQLSFDILGELIKFSKANFLIMNYYFVDHNEFVNFTSKIINKKYLIDSNVFLRSIIISLNHFNQMDKELKNKDSFTRNCKFCTFIISKTDYIFDSLIQIVKPDDINQTNISCINTALLILILQYYENNLGGFLQVIY